MAGFAPRREEIELLRSTSIVDKDAFAQVYAFAKGLIDPGFLDTSILISIGLEVVAENDPDAEWKGSRDEDAYSCIGDWSLGIDDNEFFRSSRNIFHISLSRAKSDDVFGADLKTYINTQYVKRSILSRYVAANIAFALASLLFKHPLPSSEKNKDGTIIDTDHRALCVAYPASIATSEWESYYATGVCQQCWSRAQRFGVALQFQRSFSRWSDALTTISAIMSTTDVIDKDARLQESYNKWKDVFLGVVVIGIGIGLLVTYDTNKDHPRDFFLSHLPAAISIFVLGCDILYPLLTICQRLKALP